MLNEAPILWLAASRSICKRKRWGGLSLHFVAFLLRLYQEKQLNFRTIGTRSAIMAASTADAGTTITSISRKHFTLPHAAPPPRQFWTWSSLEPTILRPK